VQHSGRAHGSIKRKGSVQDVQKLSSPSGNRSRAQRFGPLPEGLGARLKRAPALDNSATKMGLSTFASCLKKRAIRVTLECTWSTTSAKTWERVRNRGNDPGGRGWNGAPRDKMWRTCQTKERSLGLGVARRCQKTPATSLAHTTSTSPQSQPQSVKTCWNLSLLLPASLPIGGSGSIGAHRKTACRPPDQNSSR